MKFLRYFVTYPAIYYKNNKPIASFNKFQYWAYPDECKEMAIEALSHCDKESQEYQKSILSLVFGIKF